jgi:hypothetical protein
MDAKEFDFDFGGYRHTKENAALIKQRREKILEMHDSGISFDDISKAFGISKSRCRKIYSVASQKPKTLKIASVVRSAFQNHLPLFVLKDGSSIKINYPLLFIFLESKNSYFRTAKAKSYVRLIVYSSREELMLAYNNLLSKFGSETLAQKWSRSDSAVVPTCFWKSKEIESFILRCSLIRNISSDIVRTVVNHIQEIINKSPDFGLVCIGSDSEIRPDEHLEQTVPTELLKDLEELIGYVGIVKHDDSLKKEDYVAVLESALVCLSKFGAFFKQPAKEIENVKTVDVEVVDKVKEPVKSKPKAFWPKPKF